MSETLDDLKRLAEAYAVKFDDKGNGHIQLSAHGALLNYWPLSKNRTVHFNGQTIKHCSNWDAVKLLLSNGEQSLKPKDKHISKERPQVNLKPVTTNPAGVKHLYDGERAPWDYPVFIGAESDNLRVEALRLRDMADQMDMPIDYDEITHC